MNYKTKKEICTKHFCNREDPYGVKFNGSIRRTDLYFDLGEWESPPETYAEESPSQEDHSELDQAHGQDGPKLQTMINWVRELL